ncbi:MAG: CDP-alcohol phosphatidyltransferase family protein [Candidatus Krumholzibacteria bacterium]|nr:CDP-alcohol phosphatidyltransferase family protein [Candidatus Krumholzibacteria bacterium]
MEQTRDANKKAFKESARRLLDPLVSLLTSLGVSPTLISIFGLVFSLYGALLVATGSLFWGAIWLLLSGLCDVLDGSVARHRDSESKFGAFVDSSFDRISELAYFCGLILYYVSRPQGYSLFIVVVICVGLSASLLISYARARLEGLGYTCTVGLMERPERLAVLFLGLLFGSRILTLALILLAVGSVITVMQRLRYAYVITRDEPGPAPPEPGSTPP